LFGVPARVNGWYTGADVEGPLAKHDIKGEFGLRQIRSQTREM
jgi:hypothetical protein